MYFTFVRIAFTYTFNIYKRAHTCTRIHIYVCMRMYVGYTHARRSAKNTKIVGGVDTERIRGGRVCVRARARKQERGERA